MTRTFKLIKGRKDPTTFLPLSPKKGGQVINIKPKANQYLTKEQAKYDYKKTESGDIINTETLHQEIEQEKQLKKIDDTNTYKNIQHDRHPKNYYSLGISAVNKCRKNLCTKKKERDILELDFGQTLDILREEYLDVYKAIQSEILNTTRFDENSDLSTTYLGKADRSQNSKIKAEESFPISEQGYTMEKLLDGTKCQILFNTGANKSFMSKSYYM